MLNLPSHAKFLFAHKPINMGLSFDGLLGVIRNTLGADPLTPTFFLFLNKRRDKLKVFYWDDDGFAIWYKRLEKGTFQLPPLIPGEDGAIHLTRAQLTMLLQGLDFSRTQQRKRYHKKNS